jgi:hypothetical protein
METYSNILTWIIVIFMSVILLLFMGFLMAIIIYSFRVLWSALVNNVEIKEPFEGMYK